MGWHPILAQSVKQSPRDLGRGPFGSMGPRPVTSLSGSGPSVGPWMDTLTCDSGRALIRARAPEG